MMEPAFIEVSPCHAALLRESGHQLLERDEVVWFESVYSRPSGCELYVPESLDPIERYIPKARRDTLTAVELFAGCGGFSLGMEMGGIDVVAAVEWNDTAATTYLTNLGAPHTRLAFDSPKTEAKFWKRNGHAPEDPSWMGSAFRSNRELETEGVRAFFVGDVRTITGSKLLELAGVDSVDVVFGGPPCQGMSRANAKRCLEDPRNAMLWEFMRIVDELRPRAFVIENVPALITWLDGVFINRIAEIANELGYNVVANIVDACDYGVPQHRRRAIVTGTAGRPISFPMPTTWAWGRDADGRSWNMLFDEEPTDVATDDALTLFDGGV